LHALAVDDKSRARVRDLSTVCQRRSNKDVRDTIPVDVTPARHTAAKLVTDARRKQSHTTRSVEAEKINGFHKTVAPKDNVSLSSKRGPLHVRKRRTDNQIFGPVKIKVSGRSKGVPCQGPGLLAVNPQNLVPKQAAQAHTKASLQSLLRFSPKDHKCAASIQAVERACSRRAHRQVSDIVAVDVHKRQRAASKGVSFAAMIGDDTRLAAEPGQRRAFAARFCKE
jgi:hypothetical protein